MVTFKNSTAKDLIAKYNSMDFAKTIRLFIGCVPRKNIFKLVDGNNMPVDDIKIYKAP